MFYTIFLLDRDPEWLTKPPKCCVNKSNSEQMKFKSIKKENAMLHHKQVLNFMSIGCGPQLRNQKPFASCFWPHPGFHS